MENCLNCMTVQPCCAKIIASNYSSFKTIHFLGFNNGKQQNQLDIRHGRACAERHQTPCWQRSLFEKQTQTRWFFQQLNHKGQCLKAREAVNNSLLRISKFMYSTIKKSELICLPTSQRKHKCSTHARYNSKTAKKTPETGRLSHFRCLDAVFPLAQIL